MRLYGIFFHDEFHIHSGWQAIVALAAYVEKQTKTVCTTKYDDDMYNVHKLANVYLSRFYFRPDGDRPLLT